MSEQNVEKAMERFHEAGKDAPQGWPPPAEGQTIHVPDLPAPPGLCWQQNPEGLMEYCTFPAGHAGRHQWERAAERQRTEPFCRWCSEGEPIVRVNLDAQFHERGRCAKTLPQPSPQGEPVRQLIGKWRKQAKTEAAYGLKHSQSGRDGAKREYYGSVNAALALRECAEELEAALAQPAPETDIITALRNVGIDTSCGACMEVAFTGVTTNAHTCHQPSPEVAELIERIRFVQMRCGCEERYEGRYKCLKCATFDDVLRTLRPAPGSDVVALIEKALAEVQMVPLNGTPHVGNTMLYLEQALRTLRPAPEPETCKTCRGAGETGLGFHQVCPACKGSGAEPEQPAPSALSRIHDEIDAESQPAPETTQPTEFWSVSVERNGEPVVTLESHCLSGRDLSEEDERVIKTAARHLLAFLGQPAPSEIAALVESLCVSLHDAHNELLRLQGITEGLDRYDWPEWSGPAHSIRHAERLLGKPLSKTSLRAADARPAPEPEQE